MSCGAFDTADNDKLVGIFWVRDLTHKEPGFEEEFAKPDNPVYFLNKVLSEINKEA